ncbi:hypothetical protein GUJ93_ZPchr0010g8400 [Zizania palustris]|uniref:Uncharacterized protein n=1 Tax=Zizania palustris TaxID=103762 RepID=A0A8J5WA63_ZIZPA|nr:hypothetical protein GUJ93_ZPchr0010g8400 [Zizania palustris]
MPRRSFVIVPHYPAPRMEWPRASVPVRCTAALPPYVKAHQHGLSGVAMEDLGSDTSIARYVKSKRVVAGKHQDGGKGWGPSKRLKTLKRGDSA